MLKHFTKSQKRKKNKETFCQVEYSIKPQSKWLTWFSREGKNTQNERMVQGKKQLGRKILKKNVNLSKVFKKQMGVIQNKARVQIPQS